MGIFGYSRYNRLIGRRLAKSGQAEVDPHADDDDDDDDDDTDDEDEETKDTKIAVVMTESGREQKVEVPKYFASLCFKSSFHALCLLTAWDSCRNVF